MTILETVRSGLPFSDVKIISIHSVFVNRFKPLSKQHYLFFTEIKTVDKLAFKLYTI
jgi:hypothetical protein